MNRAPFGQGRHVAGVGFRGGQGGLIRTRPLICLLGDEADAADQAVRLAAMGIQFVPGPFFALFRDLSLAPFSFFALQC